MPMSAAVSAAASSDDADDDADLLIFSEDEDEDDAEKPAAGNRRPVAPWVILVVDDNHEVHAITRVVLGEVTFEGRPLSFLSAYSASEAIALLKEHSDIAVIFLDVVMETDDAGLKLVRVIREDLGNRQTRIILRTGQPGQAPERDVIVNYDINDYKAKSELTAQKLFTATVAALRSYQHITAIEQNRRGLEKIVLAADTLFERRSLRQFVEGVILQLGLLVQGASGALLCAVDQLPDPLIQGATALPDTGAAEILAGSGPYEPLKGKHVRDCVPENVLDDIALAFTRQQNVYHPDHCVLYFRSRSHIASVVYLATADALSAIDRTLIEVFCSKIALGFDNVLLYERLLAAQRGTVYALGKLAEFKDEVTGEHVRRIEALSNSIARELQQRKAFPEQIDNVFLELIGMASILHDVGKVGIPDRILQKPGRLDDEEMMIMREHANLGGTLLREAARFVGGSGYLMLGAEIAQCHHEKFDGTGYPQRLKGEEIPLAARIVAVADVYDALLHKRPYKEAWERESVISFMKEQAGSHFDNRVVEALLAVVSAENPLPAGV